MTDVPAFARAPRIDSLDVIRGIAILLILLMNIPFMGGLSAHYLDPRIIGWSPADQWVWQIQEVFLNGTQRGLLELLFGASALIITRAAMGPDDPVAPADIYYRRLLWLMLFGLVHGTLLLWPGDILLPYAIAALFLFPLRRLKPGTLLGAGIAGALLLSASAAPEWLAQNDLRRRAEAIEAAGPAAMSAEDRRTVAEWREARTTITPAVRQRMTAEAAQRRDGYAGPLAFALNLESRFLGFPVLFLTLAEIVSTMLIGMALFKWGVLQGERSTPFYLAMALAGYGVGISVNLWQVSFALRDGFGPLSMPAWAVDLGRIPVMLGHVALIHLALRSRAGALLLGAFRAPGRMALTCYIGQTIIFMFLVFPSFGLGLWGRFGWAELWALAFAAILAQLLLCNLWLRYVPAGPLEWLWRRLVAGRSSRRLDGSVPEGDLRAETQTARPGSLQPESA